MSEKRTHQLPKVYVGADSLERLPAEFSASRLLGNVFGTSNIVWAVVIGLILVYLSIGYWLGGRLADRRPEARLLYSLIGLAGLFTAAVPLISRPVLRVSASAFDALDLPLLAGSFTAVVLLLTVPVVLLGTVVPFSLRLALPDAALRRLHSACFSAFNCRFPYRDLPDRPGAYSSSGDLLQLPAHRGLAAAIELARFTILRKSDSRQLQLSPCSRPHPFHARPADNPNHQPG